MRAVESRSAQVLHADGAPSRPEEDAGRKRVQLDAKPPRKPARRVEHALSRARAGMAVGGQGNIADAHGVLLHQPTVVEIQLALDEPARAADRLVVEGEQHLACGRLDRAEEGPVVEHGLRDGLLSMEPALPAVARGIDADLGEQAIRPPVVTVLELLEVAAHAPGAPGGVPGEALDVLPVGVVGIDHDHGVVGGAAAQRARARIEDAVDAGAVPVVAILRILLLARLAAVVAHEEVPGHRVVLASEAVEGWHIVVVGHPVAVGIEGIAATKLAGIAPRFEQDHGVPGLRETGGHRAPARPRADDDILAIRRHGLRHRYKVLRNSIRARLSSSLSPGSSLKALVPK